MDPIHKLSPEERAKAVANELYNDLRSMGADLLGGRGMFILQIRIKKAIEDALAEESEMPLPATKLTPEVRKLLAEDESWTTQTEATSALSKLKQYRASEEITAMTPAEFEDFANKLRFRGK